MLWSYCSHHDGGYYFYDVRIERLTNKADNKSWASEPDMRKVRGLCMLCGRADVFFVSLDELEEHRYSPLDLCQCGLPYYHKKPAREFLQQYNAVPVDCRPSTNGRANL